jgi:3-hydroxyisobutyrate dehydrogenase-like beta-hydroxyacid dehydrogenase
MSTIGLIGLGNMGLPVARRLRGLGRDIVAFDTSTERMAQAAQCGARSASSADEVAGSCEVIVLSLPKPAVVRTVVAQIAPALRDGACVVDLSTNDPATSREMAALVAQHGGSYIDAPVSGGPSRAATGELTLMVGGADDAVARVRPVLAEIGKQVEHVGLAGCGCIAKLLNNYVALWNMAGVSQAFLAASSLDISLDRLYDVMNRSSAQSYSLARNFPKIRSGDFSPNFALDLAEKDLRLALELMHQAGSSTFAEDALRGLFESSARADPARDVAAIYQTLAEQGKNA